MCTAIVAIVSAVASLASTGLAIAQAVDGDLAGASKSLAAAAGAAGAAYMAYQQSPTLSGSNMASSVNDDLSGSALSDNLPSSSSSPPINKSSNISFKPQQSISSGLLGDNNSLSGTNADMQTALTPSTMPMLQPQKQIATQAQIADANKPDTGLLGSIGNTIGGWIGAPNTASLASGAGMDQSKAPASPTTGGLLGALNSNAGLNLTNTIGSGLASMASAQTQKEAEQMKIDAAKNTQEDIRKNNATSPIILGGKKWDAVTSQWVAI